MLTQKIYYIKNNPFIVRGNKTFPLFFKVLANKCDELVMILRILLNHVKLKNYTIFIRIFSNLAPSSSRKSLRMITSILLNTVSSKGKGCMDDEDTTFF